MSTPIEAPATVETPVSNPWADIVEGMKPEATTPAPEAPVEAPVEAQPVVTPPPVQIDPNEFASLREEMDALKNQVAPPPAPALPHYAGYFDDHSGFTSSVDVANIRELYSESAPEMVAMAEDYARLVDVVNNAILPMLNQTRQQAATFQPIAQSQMVEQVKSTFEQAAQSIKSKLGVELSGDELGRGMIENLPKLIEANGNTYTPADLERWWYSYNIDKVLAAKGNLAPSDNQAPAFPVAPPVNGVSAVTPGAATTTESRIFAAFVNGNQGK